MTIATNTFLTFAAKGNREDLSDIISDVSPTYTPFLSNAGTAVAKGVLTEWQMDVLATAADNKHLQGDETSFGAVTATVRVGNYTQISKKSFVISGTQEAVDKAGRDSEIAREQIKKGKELKRDMEVTLLTNKSGVGGNSTTEPELAGLGAWIKSNDIFDAGGASPTWTSGVPTLRSDGSQGAFTVTMLKDALRLAFASGAEPTTLMVGPYNKQVVSGFAGIAVENINQTGREAASIIGAADFYRSDYGLITVVPNRFQRERDAFLMDWDMVKVAYLRPMFSEPLAKTGDAEKRHMVVEYTLKVENEAGLAGIFDLSAS